MTWQGMKTDDLNSEVVLKKMLTPSRSLLLWGKFFTLMPSKLVTRLEKESVVLGYGAYLLLFHLSITSHIANVTLLSPLRTESPPVIKCVQMSQQSTLPSPGQAGPLLPAGTIRHGRA